MKPSSLWTPIAALLLACCAAAPAAEPASQAKRTFNIESQSVRDALRQFGEQTGLQVFFRTETVSAQGMTTPRVVGELSPQEALELLLANTGLRYEFVNEKTVAIRGRGEKSTSMVGSPGEQMRVALREEGEIAEDRKKSDTKPGEEDDSSEYSAGGIPEILVKGARASSADIRRTENDAQPYVVFDSEEIERSMAPDLDTFLRTRLPMNQSRAANGQDLNGVKGNQSTVNLRGLGASQTLVLVNGRRMPGVPGGLDFDQPDINGIPVSAVERIEILPSTAGGIYGGGATGGVVNVVLKRNYSGLELTARYDGTFAGGGAQRRIDAMSGFTLGEKTSVMLTASYRDGNPLYVGDRDFTLQARRLKLRNNPGLPNGVTGVFPGVATTNITSVSGNDLVLLDGMRTLNSPRAYVPVGYSGPAGDGGAAFLGTAGGVNLELPEDFSGAGYPLLPAPAVRSLAVSLRRELSDRMEAFVDISHNDNRAERISFTAAGRIGNVRLPVGPGNPFTEPVNLLVPFAGYDAARLTSMFQSLSEQLTGGFLVRLPHAWTVQTEYSLSRSRYKSDYPRDPLTVDGMNALVDGRLNLLRDVNSFPPDYAAYYPEQDRRYVQVRPGTRRGGTLRMAGPLWTLPGGPLRLAALLEDQRQYTGDQVSYRFYEGDTAPTFIYNPEVGTTNRSAYAELTAPLFSPANARRALHSLDLQMSYRHDETSTRTVKFGDFSLSVPSFEGPFPEVPFQINKVSGNQYTLGFRYAPGALLALRASYGEGIFPPPIWTISESEVSPVLLTIFRLVDPKRGGQPITAATVERMVATAGSLQLRPEVSQSWSVGAILTPDNLPGFRLSVDYTRIEKVDEIGSLSPQSIIDLEDRFPGRVVRNPLTPADQALGYTGGTVRALDTGYINIAHSQTEALDIQMDYSLLTRLGTFAVNVLATVQPRLTQQPTPESVPLDKVGYSDGPLKWRANAGLRWSRGALDLGWSLQYYDRSLVYTSTASSTVRNTSVLNQGSAWIGTQTYHDVYGRYRFHAPGFGRTLLENAELQVSVQNVLNTSPPILAASELTGLTRGYATEGDPRLRRYSIAFTKRFGL